MKEKEIKWMTLILKHIMPRKGCPLPALFNIFVRNKDSGIERTPSKFSNTKLHDAVHMLEGKDAIQMDLEKLVRWTCVNILKLNKGKCEVLHLGYGLISVQTCG